MPTPSQVLRGDAYVGADRKGPLAAFIVIAIIAAILLVTSVRSQAAPALLTAAPAGDVVVAPPQRAATDVSAAIGDARGQEVRDGIVLGHRAASGGAGVVTGVATATAAGLAAVNRSADGVPAPQCARRAHRGGHAHRGHPRREHADEEGRHGHGPAGHGPPGPVRAQPAPPHDRGHHHGSLHQARGHRPR